MPQSQIKECCIGMASMLNDKTLTISDISKRGWIKVLVHDGTTGLGLNPVAKDYNNISYCPFCGNRIEKRWEYLIKLLPTAKLKKNNIIISIVNFLNR